MIRMGCGCGMKFSGGARKMRKTRRLRKAQKVKKSRRAKKTQKVKKSRRAKKTQKK